MENKQREIEMLIDIYSVGNHGRKNYCRWCSAKIGHLAWCEKFLTTVFGYKYCCPDCIRMHVRLYRE